MISLTSIQWQDGEKNETELLTQASVTKKDGWNIISYEDTEATGFEGSVTTIKVQESNVNATIIREGTANSVLCLEEGKKHFCHYGTPYGDMQIGVNTLKIENTLDKNGRLYMKYSLDLNSFFLSDNEIIMQIKN